VKNCRVHPTHWLISTQLPALRVRGLQEHAAADGEARRGRDLRRDAVAGPAHRSCLTSPRVARGRPVDAWRFLRAPKRTSMYRYLGTGSPLAASFCVRRRTCTKPKCTFRTQVWLLRQPFRPFLACRGGRAAPFSLYYGAPLPGGDARRAREGYSQLPRRRIT
jgi:hypothetical protein